jgi:serine/threonine protein kinase
MGNGQGKPFEPTGEVNLNHFRLLRVVGRGAFGKVRIVERKDTGLSFALKYIRKDEGKRNFQAIWVLPLDPLSDPGRSTQANPKHIPSKC